MMMIRMDSYQHYFDLEDGKIATKQAQKHKSLKLQLINRAGDWKEKSVAKDKINHKKLILGEFVLDL